jgi:hypothetical protein
MNTAQRVIVSAGKAALFSSGLLVLFLLYAEKIYNEWSVILIFSVGITFVIAIGMIVLTILPLYLIERSGISGEIIFKKYFPFYAMVFFSSCLFIVVSSEFNTIITAICVIAYFTAMMSWIWMFKPKR